MKKQKVYIDELPARCWDCPCHDREFYGCQAFDFTGTKNFDSEFDASEECYKDCPLQSIKTHDRKLVKKVCKKIKEYCENWKQYADFYNYVLVEETTGIRVCPTLYDILDQIQRENEN